MNRSILLLIILAVYGRSGPIYFSGDDWVFLEKAMRGWDFASMFSFSPGSFAPLINTAFFLFYRFFQLNYIYYHLVILAIHTLNSFLLFFIIKSLSRNQQLAFLTALVFTVFSPYHQIVIWIDGLPGIITSIFVLFSVSSFILYRQKQNKSFYLLSLISFILAILCKEWAVVLFPLLFLYDLFFNRQKDSPLHPIKPYLPFIIIVSIYLLAELALPYSGKKGMIGPHLFSNLSTYLTTFILPSQNIAEFPVKVFIPILNSTLPLLVKLSSVLLPLLTLIALIRGSNFVKFQILWVYVTILPFIFFTWGTASRYYYLASMGFAALLAYLFLTLYKASNHKAGKTALSLGLVLFLITHIFFIEIRITRLYRQNKEIQNILSQLQNISPHFPAHSRLFFSGFNYDRKWGYAVRTIYRDPTLRVYRNLPSSQDLRDNSSLLFIFNYNEGLLMIRNGETRKD